MAPRYYEPAPRPPGYGGSGGGSIADIILRGGDQQAQYHLARGQMWADTMQGLGQTIGTAIQQHGEQKQIAKRDQAWLDFVDSGTWQDPKVAATQTLKIWGPGPEGREQLQALGGIMQLSQPKQNPEATRKAAESVVRGLALVSPEARAAKWGQARGMILQAYGALDPKMAAELEQMVPAEYSDDAWKIASGMIGGAAAPTPVKLGQGETLVDPTTGKPIATGQPKPVEAPAVGSFEDYLIQKFGERPNPAQIAQARREYAQADNAPGAGGPRPLTQTAEAGLIARWSKDYDTATKPARDLARALSMMDAGLKSAKAGDLNAGSQAVLVTFQKLLDPTSVVRESEYARSAEGLALLDRISGYYQRLTQGGPGVPVGELEEFARVGRQFVEGYNKHAEGVKSRIGKAADRYGIPHELIFSDYSSGGAPAAQAAPGGAAPAANAANAAPPRPPGVPANAKWDPSRRRWVL